MFGFTPPCPAAGERCDLGRDSIVTGGGVAYADILEGFQLCFEFIHP